MDVNITQFSVSVAICILSFKRSNQSVETTIQDVIRYILKLSHSATIQFIQSNGHQQLVMLPDFQDYADTKNYSDIDFKSFCQSNVNLETLVQCSKGTNLRQQIFTLILRKRLKLSNEMQSKNKIIEKISKYNEKLFRK
ncbi:hypothetical protein SS50377_27977 [Spironucleus salmonicida]|uniref:Uncharacterized protein n=1 Tax=Spironucleus salmonicida TaxID=348837 RepID=A0A9P8LKV1_9EUKA|nr:hypothetical protein SS50377_27977 [Spironucleus salmonicida]